MTTAALTPMDVAGRVDRLLAAMAAGPCRRCS